MNLRAMRLTATLFAALALGTVTGTAALLSAQSIEQMVDDYFAQRETKALGKPLSMPEALVAQRGFVKRLESRLGKPSGYKVGLVTREMQERFGVEAPVRGILLEKMLLPNRSEVPPGFAVRPLLEADLIVVVNDRGINKAQSIVEIAEHLKDLIAFIELPDAFIPTNPPPSGAQLTAANLGARLGVLGNRLAVQPTSEFIKALAEMKVTITDGTGVELGRGQGKVILDHPLNAVLWLMEELHRSGERLKAGDMISLGSIKAIPAPAGKTVTVRYEGLPGVPLEATVHFR